MKRFWTEVAVTGGGGAFGIALDGRPVRTPARAELRLPDEALAEAVADEWRAQQETVDPRSMPLTGLANAAIDRAGPDLADSIARYGESDLLYYRADGPPALVARQAELWDPLLQWARQRFDVDFGTGSGVVHIPQPESTLRTLRHAVEALDRFRLAALSPLVTIGGSLVAGLAVVEQAVEPGAAWEAVSVDDQWQLEQWGSDQEAERALEGRRSDFIAAARFAGLVGR
jgi:chaperone required for assembly of F1-ATPase